MDKKDKILILLAPVAVVVGGYVYFGDGMKEKNSQATMLADDFTHINAPDSSAKKTRTELYRDKYQEEHGDIYKRKIQNDDSFFGDEVSGNLESNSEKNQELGSSNATESESSEGTADKENEKVAGGQLPGKAKSQNLTKSKTKSEIPKSNVEHESEINLNATTPNHDNSNGVAGGRKRRTGFYASPNTESQTANNPTASTTDVANILHCVVQEGIQAKQGSNISLRTTEDVVINNVRVSKNTLITGVITLGGERLSIAVTTIKGETRNIAVKMKAYDLDGNEGIAVEGGVDKEIKKDAVNEALAEARTIVKVPIISSLPVKLGSKKVNDPTVPVEKGMKLVLKN